MWYIKILNMLLTTSIIPLWQGIGADFARAYISNVCVAKELQRNGLGYELIAKSKMVAEDWGKNHSCLRYTEILIARD